MLVMNAGGGGGGDIFRIVFADLLAGAQKVEDCNKAIESAKARTAAVNNQFIKYSGGMWAIAELGSSVFLQNELASFQEGLSGYSKTLQDALHESQSTLRTDRDKIFSDVDGGADGSQVYLNKGSAAVPNGIDTAYDDILKLYNNAEKCIQACSGLEDSGAITSALSDLKSACQTSYQKLENAGDDFSVFQSAVEAFEGSYSSRLNPDLFITDAMNAKANESTLNSVFGALGFGDNPLKNAKAYLKNFKNGMGLFGWILEGAPTWEWDRQSWESLKDSWMKKLSEKTGGLLGYFKDKEGHVFAGPKAQWDKFASNMKKGWDNGWDDLFGKDGLVQHVKDGGGKGLVDYLKSGKGKTLAEFFKTGGKYAGWAADALTFYTAFDDAAKVREQTKGDESAKQAAYNWTAGKGLLKWGVTMGGSVLVSGVTKNPFVGMAAGAWLGDKCDDFTNWLENSGFAKSMRDADAEARRNGFAGAGANYGGDALSPDIDFSQMGK